MGLRLKAILKHVLRESTNTIRLLRHSDKCLFTISTNSEIHGGPLPPAGLGQAGGETERAPRLGLCLKAILKHMFRESKSFFNKPENLGNVCCQLRQIPRSTVNHCPPRNYAKRGARPNELLAWDFVWRPPRRATFLCWSGV